MESKDIKKTDVRRNLSRKRKKNRRRGFSAFVYILIIIAAIIILVGVLCSTVFFNIKKFIVEGNVDKYTPEEIVNASGIETKDNLIWVDTDAAEKRIVRNLVYIETAKITRQWPNKLEISVTKCKKAFNFDVGNKYLIVSEAGKILESSDTPDSSLVTYKGFEPKDEIQGHEIVSKDEQKDTIFQLTADVVDSGLKYPIDSIDMTDKYSITVGLDGRIKFSAGSWTDMDYKIKLAETALDNLDSDESGVMTMVGENQISFRTNENVEASSRREHTKRDALRKEEETATETTSEEDNDNNLVVD